jgi:DNA-binding NarL/FixJ family response regulator
MKSDKIEVLLVDDHLVVIEGIRLLLNGEVDIQVCAYALSGEDALNQLAEITPDVILLDLNMPGMNGIDTCKKIKAKYPDIKIVILTMLKDSSLIKLLLKSGADGYLLKNSGKAEIVEAIRAVNLGQRYLGYEVKDILLDSISLKERKPLNPMMPRLSRRETEILQMIVDEFTTQEIAEKLFISFSTVETHRRNILIKLGARNTAGLVRVAIENNLLD